MAPGVQPPESDVIYLRPIEFDRGSTGATVN